MLKRTISSIVAVLLLAVVLMLKNTFFFNVAFAILCSVAVYELLKAFKLLHNKLISFSCIIYAFVSVMITYFKDFMFITAQTVECVLSFALAFVLLCSMLFSKYSIKFEQIATAFCSAMFLSFSFKSYIQIKDLVNEFNTNATLYILILTACGAWIADTSAYLVGSKLGKHKLCPTISPKKSIEGFIGGVAFNAVMFPLLGLLFSSINSSLTPNYFLLLLLGVFCALAGCIGDLFASYIKRCTGIKDYGKIMPGHGGVLDRFDSFVLVAPVIYLLLQVFYKFAPIL